MELEITVYNKGCETLGTDHEELILDVLTPIFRDLMLPFSYEIAIRECLDGTLVLVCMDKGKYIRFPKNVLDHVIAYSNGDMRRLVGDKLPLTADNRLELLLEEWN
jgi:hypothetical protein